MLHLKYFVFAAFCPLVSACIEHKYQEQRQRERNAPGFAKKLGMSYVTQNIWKPSISNDSTTPIAHNENDHGIQCYMTENHNNSTNKKMDYANMEVLLRQNLAESVNIINTILLDSTRESISFPNGFWEYEIVNNTIMQQHDQDADLRYVLGRRNTNAHECNDFKLSYDSEGYYISEKVAGTGDVCELNGGHPRTIELQYTCGSSRSETAGSFLWIKEDHVCQYVARVAIPQLCTLEIFDVRSNFRDGRVEDEVETNLRDGNQNSLVCYATGLEENDTSDNLAVTAAPATTTVNNLTSVVDIITNYKPEFLGYGFYHLTHYNTQNSDYNITALLYSGDLKSLDGQFANIKESYIQRVAKNYPCSLVSTRIIDLHNELLGIVTTNVATQDVDITTIA